MQRQTRRHAGTQAQPRTLTRHARARTRHAHAHGTHTDVTCPSVAVLIPAPPDPPDVLQAGAHSPKPTLSMESRANELGAAAAARTAAAGRNALRVAFSKFDVVRSSPG